MANIPTGLELENDSVVADEIGDVFLLQLIPLVFQSQLLLGKLGLGLFVLGLAGIAGFIYDAPAKVSPGLCPDLLGTNRYCKDSLFTCVNHVCNPRKDTLRYRYPKAYVRRTLSSASILAAWCMTLSQVISFAFKLQQHAMCKASRVLRALFLAEIHFSA